MRDVDRQISRALHGSGQLSRLAALCFTADLHQYSLAFMQMAAARMDLALRQESRPVAADIDKRGAKRWKEPRYPAEVAAAELIPIAALDPQFDRRAIFDECRAPLAGAGGYQKLAAHRGRYPRPASSCAVSNKGNPTTLEYEPEMNRINAAARP